MVRGTVVDEEGNPRMGVKISLFDPATMLRFTIKTDNKGKFFGRGNYPSTYEITFQLEGYQPINNILSVEAGSDKKLNITMTKAQT